MDAQDFLNRCSDYPQNRKHDFIVSDLINVVEECRHWIIGGRLKAFTVYAQRIDLYPITQSAMLSLNTPGSDAGH